MGHQEHDPEWPAFRARQVADVQGALTSVLARTRTLEREVYLAGTGGGGDDWSHPLLLALADVSAAVTRLERAAVMVRAEVP